MFGRKAISFSLILGALLIQGCTKEVPKEFQKKEIPNDPIHNNLKQEGESDGKQDEAKADKFSKEADDADAKYQASKSDTDKKEAIEKQMAAANFLMFDANLSPRKKYRNALKRYRRVLELEPNNEEAARNKKTIEDIYTQMGMPIPE